MVRGRGEGDKGEWCGMEVECMGTRGIRRCGGGRRAWGHGKIRVTFKLGRR